MAENFYPFHGVAAGVPKAFGHLLKRNCARKLPVKRWVSSRVFLYFSIIILTGSVIRWFNVSKIGNALQVPEGLGCQCTLNHSDKGTAGPKNPMPTKAHPPFTATCPDHFHWIHEDLRPWKITGITRDMLARAKGYAYFRLAIVDGKVYMEKYKNCFQTRDVFTVWGILQLLRWYPDKIPDLELMFSCDDKPEIEKSQFQRWLAEFFHSGPPPPLFQYCGDEDSVGILFPDWTFWGWAETNLRPWASLLKDLLESNKMTEWKDREPYAYWRGNPKVNPNRGELIKCNVSGNTDFNVRIYKQDWVKEAKQGFKESKLEVQCTHRYKIYLEGRGWSVSDKYILACDSMVLLVKPRYYDFFTRSLVPSKHYWPITTKKMCRDIKFAVDWANNHADEALAIGKAGSAFIQENLGMEYVYDYMFHSLNEYAKLLKFKPEVPKGAVEMCWEKMTCSQKGLWKEFMMDSMVHDPSSTLACTMPTPYEPADLQSLVERNKNVARQVELLESEHWEKSRKKLWRPLYSLWD